MKTESIEKLKAASNVKEFDQFIKESEITKDYIDELKSSGFSNEYLALIKFYIKNPNENYSFLDNAFFNRQKDIFGVIINAKSLEDCKMLEIMLSDNNVDLNKKMEGSTYGSIIEEVALIRIRLLKSFNTNSDLHEKFKKLFDDLIYNERETEINIDNLAKNKILIPTTYRGMENISDSISKIRKELEDTKSSIEATRALYKQENVATDSLNKISLKYFKSLVEVLGFNLDLQNKINELTQHFPENGQIKEISKFLDEFRKERLAKIEKSFEDNFTLLIPHLPNVTADFIEANTKDKNVENGIKKFPESFVAPAYAFREGGQASNFNDQALKRFFAPKVIVKDEKENVVEIFDNSPLNLILELLNEKNGRSFLKMPN